MFARRGIDLLPNRSFDGVLQAQGHRSTGHVADIASLLIVALSPTNFEIPLAYLFRLLAEMESVVAGL